jgi:formylmethanofuran dehydrogenase subunit E
VGTDDRQYLVCDLCGELVLLDDVFAYADERMLVCRTCTTAEVWTAGAGPSDNADGGLTRS